MGINVRDWGGYKKGNFWEFVHLYLCNKKARKQLADMHNIRGIEFSASLSWGHTHITDRHTGIHDPT